MDLVVNKLSSKTLLKEVKMKDLMIESRFLVS